MTPEDLEAEMQNLCADVVAAEQMGYPEILVNIRLLRHFIKCHKHSSKKCANQVKRSAGKK